MSWKATNSLGTSAESLFTVEVNPLITEPNKPDTQYYIIGMSPKIEIILDYSP